MTNIQLENKAIDTLIADFFSVFDNRSGQVPDLNKLRKLMIPEALIIKNCDSNTEVFNIDAFIKPREILLTSGELVEFFEEEVSAKTDIFGDIAQRFCVYKKSGETKGETFEIYGKKTIQLIKVGEKWMITSVAWTDETENLKIETSFRK
ncbi:nuclear transport factor 2 family protein [Aliikangiella coralliicola]|uniref:Nuclear transport factor 2 family protein n=1 Tax=Aliikangiella coralliicola TaxID=2592383 RepID=A0A545UFC6_9GAMM|nr:nuclear transport factor 2 family protein [Aliikangiella coralliicola]TQV88093.1 nuclear transport factor 2 family protein [Aliikangiella coralliicola]